MWCREGDLGLAPTPLPRPAAGWGRWSAVSGPLLPCGICHVPWPSRRGRCRLGRQLLSLHRWRDGGECGTPMWQRLERD